MHFQLPHRNIPFAQGQRNMYWCVLFFVAFYFHGSSIISSVRSELQYMHRLRDVLPHMPEQPARLEWQVRQHMPVQYVLRVRRVYRMPPRLHDMQWAIIYTMRELPVQPSGAEQWSVSTDVQQGAIL
jgi:hypothetical protein